MKKLKLALASVLAFTVIGFGFANTSVSATEAETNEERETSTENLRDKIDYTGADKTGITTFALGAFDSTSFDVDYPTGVVSLAQGESFDISRYYADDLSELKFMCSASAIADPGLVAYQGVFGNAELDEALNTASGIAPNLIYGWNVGATSLDIVHVDPDTSVQTFITAIPFDVTATPVNVIGIDKPNATVAAGDAFTLTVLTSVPNAWWFWMDVDLDAAFSAVVTSVGVRVASWNEEADVPFTGTYNLIAENAGEATVTFTMPDGTVVTSIITVVGPQAPSAPQASTPAGVATGDATNMAGLATLLGLSAVVLIAYRKRNA